MTVRALDRFPLPLWVPKTSGYGPRWGSFHYGCDYGCPIGTPVYAPWDGIVGSGDGPAGGDGLDVWLTNSDRDVLKCFHLSRIVAALGANVRAGDLIALTGNSGASTGPHAHIEIHDGRPNNPIDPTALLDAAQHGTPSTPPPVLPPPAPADPPKVARMIYVKFPNDPKHYQRIKQTDGKTWFVHEGNGQAVLLGITIPLASGNDWLDAEWADAEAHGRIVGP